MKKLEETRRRELAEGLSQIPPPIISNLSLVARVVAQNEADEGEADVEEVKEEDFEHGQEIERRYLPSAEDSILTKSGDLDEERLRTLQKTQNDWIYARHPDMDESSLPKFQKRLIEQRYLTVFRDHKMREEDAVRIRLRLTHLYDDDGKEIVQTRYRVAIKSHVKGKRNARNETQAILNPEKPPENAKKADIKKWEQELKEFRYLFSIGFDNTIFTRCYNTLLLPIDDDEDHFAELHTEFRHAPVAVEDMVRFEAEYRTRKGERFAKKHKELALPTFVGEDVTKDENMKASAFLEKGPSDAWIEAMDEIQPGKMTKKERLKYGL